MKSYNQRYKESGTTLSYKEWRKREDEKMSSFDGVKIPQPNLYDSTLFKQTQNELLEKSGYKSNISNKTTFGIPKYVMVLGGVLIIGAIAYKIYKKIK